MADVAAAQADLRAVEAILRRRYHYPHPIFDHIAAAQEHLGGGEVDGEDEAAAPSTAEPEAASEPEPGKAQPTPVTEEKPAAEKPKRRTTRTRK